MTKVNDSRKYLDPRTLAKLQGLKLRARHIVEGYVAGLHRSPFHGFSIEFAEHRDYAPGDDLRYLDWKVYGRTDKLYLKQFEDETNLVCYIILDVSESMGFRGPDSPMSKLEYAQCMAAALAWLVLQQQDAVGICTFDCEVRALLRPSSNPSQLQQAVQVLESARAGETTSAGPIFHQLAQRLNKRGVVIILSDLFDNTESLLAGLKHFRHRRHDVILFHVLDAAEVEFPFHDPTLFRGLEHLPDVHVDPAALRRAYLDEFGSFLNSVQAGCRGQQIDYQMLRTDKPFDRALSSYLASRNEKGEVMGGFANGLMLLFGLSAAIPVIIHLWNRRRFREIQWAAMEYLLAAIRKHSRRIRIEQLILLVVRILILLSLSLALADPYIRGGLRLASGASGGHTHWVFVVDGSYSMAFQDGDSSHFDAVKKRVMRMLDKSTRGDGFTLILMADPPRVVIREPSFSKSDVEEELESMNLPHGGGDLIATLAEVQSVVESAQEKESRLTATRVCFLTDLGATTWNEVEKPEARRAVGRIAKFASLHVIDAGPMAGMNLAVTNLAQNETLATTARELVYTADIRNFASQDQSQLRVEFFVDNRKVDEDRIDVPALGTATATFLQRFTSPGDHVVEIRIADDVLATDNRRWLSVPVRSSIKVLCVEGSPGAARHTVIALEPSTSAYRRIETTVVPETALLDQAFDSYQCVLFCNVRRFSDAIAARMNTYVRDGGGLVFLLGDQVDADSYNRQLGSNEDARGMLPVVVGQAVPLGRYAFDPLQYRHRIVEPFRDYVEAGLLSTPVWKYVRLIARDDSAVKTALQFDNGDPAIVEQAVDKGHVVVYAGAVSPLSVDRTSQPPTPWTAIYTWPSFPPLIQETVSLAISGQTRRQNLLVGDSLEGTIANSVAEMSLQVESPVGDSQRVQLAVDGGDSHWQYGTLEQSGNYTARFGPPLAVTRTYAANVETQESDLERIDLEILPSQFAGDVDFDDDVVAEALVASQTDVFQSLLLVLLGLLVLESILAWYFGRARGMAR